MDSPACHVIYVNRSVGRERLVPYKPDDATEASGADTEDDAVRQEIQPLLDSFGDDTPHDDHTNDERASRRTPSPTSESPAYTAEIHAPDEELYGLNLLQKIITESHLRNIAKLVVPIPIISHAQSQQLPSHAQMTDGAAENIAPLTTLAANREIIRKCLDIGAVDVIISPLSSKCIATLEICAYRSHRDAEREQAALLEIKRGRQRSWVGVNEEKPYAYLREAMVSGLMKGICRLGPDDEQRKSMHVAVSSERQAVIAEAVGQWHFSAHLFTDDELVVAAMVMFKHALSMPELEQWRIPADQLINFLVACRAAYNSFVPYHNFRHVVDVLQATFSFVVHIGAIAPYKRSRDAQPATPVERSPMASLLGPFEALTLLITAIGHDVGHPGVNNGFLVTLNAPLAQLYNDRSVLESFHCAAYSQILRRYWSSAFEHTKMRNLMISSILATDMGLHFDYMKRLGDVQEKLQENNSTDLWNGRLVEEQKALACSLLIKCADISNVARRHDAAVKWMHILSEEFSRQASMEDELQIQSSLMAPPKRDLTSLAKAQLSFMNLFAIPLFQGVADIMPTMRYTVDELDINKARFEQIVDEERIKQTLEDPTRRRLMAKDGTFSPRTMSFAVPMEEPTKDTTLISGGPAEAQVESSTKSQAEESPEGYGETPTTLVDGKERAEQGLDPRPSDPAEKPAHIPRTNEAYKEVNGTVSMFDAVRQLANSDPFNTEGHDDAVSGDTGTTIQRRQRSSEATDGSTSGAGGGDWASQATSATTSKMPISPSTQGTSIVSKESADRPASAPGFKSCLPTMQDSTPTLTPRGKANGNEEGSPSGSIGKAEGRILKKKSSRFRMKDFHFFRRHHKGSSPSDAAG